MAIAITGVVAAAASRFIAQPVQGYLDSGRRATLTDRAQLALERIARETHLALPNSLRVSGTGAALELLRIRTGARYRAEAPGDPLSFTLAADTFDVVGGLADAASVAANPAALPGDCASGNVDCLVIYNTGQSGADAYAQDNVAAIRAASAAAVSFTATAPFPLASPGQRFYVVDTPVTYLCDTGAGLLRRYAGYSLNPSQSTVDTHGELVGAGAAFQLLADGVTGCRFAYQPGTATRGGLVTLALTLSEGGESVTLLEQVHVGNLP